MGVVAFEHNYEYNESNSLVIKTLSIRAKN